MTPTVTPDHVADQALVAAVLRGERAATRHLFDHLDPLLQQIARALLRGARAAMDAADLAQEAWLGLRERGWRRLGCYDASRGRLQQFVRRVGRRLMVSVLRRLGYSGAAELPESPTLEYLGMAESHERACLARDELAKVLAALAGGLSPLTLRCFRRQVLDGASTGEVMAQLRLSRNALNLHQFRARAFARVARAALAKPPLFVQRPRKSASTVAWSAPGNS